ncbi:MAG: SdiA-regulated domain-containing protein [Myxococcota bacterium]
MTRVAAWGPTSSRRTAPENTAARFELKGSLATKMPEASDVVALPGGRFLVVGDRKDSAVLVEADGKRSSLKLPGLPNGNSQLEGVAYDPVRHHLFVVREEKRELLRYEWNPDKSKPPVLEKAFKLDREGPTNKGVEGLAFISGDVSPTGTPRLLVAKEGKPRELALHDDGGGGKPLPIKLEKEVYAVCRDFSAVAVDPKTGHLFVSSDESAAVAQIRLMRDGDKVVGKLVQSFPLRDDKGKTLDRVEGLTFNAKGDLFVLTENDGKLHHLGRTGQ